MLILIRAAGDRVHSVEMAIRDVLIDAGHTCIDDSDDDPSYDVLVAYHADPAGTRSSRYERSVRISAEWGWQSERDGPIFSSDIPLDDLEHNVSRGFIDEPGEDDVKTEVYRLGARLTAASAELDGTGESLDQGQRLLEPITYREYAGIERVLDELWKVLQDGALAPVHEAQVLAMAQFIEGTRQLTEPERSQRWELVGAVRSGLRYLAKELPKDALAWWKLSELLAEIDWNELAQLLP